jgi:septal ring factor EnvC (AmiA/AmiB activator)
MKLARLLWVNLLVVLLVATWMFGACPGALTKKTQWGSPEPAKFDRAQIMIINLNHGQSSCGFYLADSLATIKLTNKNLEKALKQLEQVDRAYAKSRHRPDDSFLAPAHEQIKKAKETCERLETELRQSLDELKSSIQQTLVVEGNKS